MKKPTTAEIAALAIRFQASREMLSLIVKESATDKEAGRRALLLAFILAPELIGNQRELASRCGVTEARASQMLRVFRERL